MTNRYTKLTRVIPTTRAIANTVAHIFLENWVKNFGIPSKLLTFNGHQFVQNFFVSFCITLVVNNITPSEYHPENNDEAERFNYTLISRVCHSMFEHEAV